MKINEVLDEKIQQARLEPLSVPNLNTKLSTSKDNSVEQQIQNAFAKALDKIIKTVYSPATKQK